MENRTCGGASDIEDEEEAERRKGPWTLEEDTQLMGYISLHGEGRWSFLAKTAESESYTYWVSQNLNCTYCAGLKRTGRSCRLRWLNSLRPDLKRSKITAEEGRLIIELHGLWGNRWSRIARSLPGRTDNDIKNYWRTRIKGKLNLQAEDGSTGMDAENQLQFDRVGSSYHPTSSQRPPDVDSIEPSTSFAMQNTEEIKVQKNKSTDDISPQVIPSHDGLQGEIHGPGQPGAALQKHLEESANSMFENSFPYNFSVGSLVNLLHSSEFCGDSATQDGTISPPSYMVASPEAFSDSEAYLNRYSDVLWNMDQEDDHFFGSKHSAFSY